MLFQSNAFSDAFVQTLEYAACGGAAIDECLLAASQIQDNDCESWHVAWVSLADRVRQQAAHDLSHKRKGDVRDGFLRAAQYYRTAGRFLNRNPGGDARIATTASASRACFATAMRLTENVREIVEIKAVARLGRQTTTYLYRAADRGGVETASSPARPTVLVVGECGVSAMELYFSCASALVRRGWHCLALASPEAIPSADLASSLLSAAVRLAPVDPACLALMTFRDETGSPRESLRRRIVCMSVMGTADELKAVIALPHLPCRETTSSTLNDLRQALFRWLD